MQLKIFIAILLYIVFINIAALKGNHFARTSDGTKRINIGPINRIVENQLAETHDGTKGVKLGPITNLIGDVAYPISDSQVSDNVVVIQIPMLDSQDLEAASRIGIATAVGVASGLAKGTSLLVKWIKG